MVRAGAARKRGLPGHPAPRTARASAHNRACPGVQGEGGRGSKPLRLGTWSKDGVGSGELPRGSLTRALGKGDWQALLVPGP